MTEPNRFDAAAAAVMAGLAVALGAWAAHGLGEVLQGVHGSARREVMGRFVFDAAKYLGDFRTGVTYQTAAALGVLATAAWPGRAARAGRRLVLAGAVVFSGSLYALALSGAAWLGAVTPVGGLLMLAGWAALAWSAARRPGAGGSP